MANDHWGLFNFDEALRTQIENLASAINKEALEKNLQKVVQDLKDNDINALLGLGSEPSKIEGAGPAPAKAQAPAPASTPISPPAKTQASAKAPVPAPAPAPAQVPKRSASASAQSQTPSVSSKGSSDSVKVAPALSRSASAQSQTPSVSSQVSSLFRRASSTGSSVSSSLVSVFRSGSSENSSKSQPNEVAPSTSSSRAASTSSSIAPSRTPPKDNLRQQESEGKKLSILKRVSSGLSMCRSSLSRGAEVYVGVEINKNKDTVFRAEKKLRLPETPSFKKVSSGLGRSVSSLGRSASRLGEALSSSVSQASEGVKELRRESSLRDSFRDARENLRSLRYFKNASSGPSSIPSPRSWVNLSSVRSSSNYGQDFKNALSGVGGLVGEAGSQTRDWASNFRRSASELSLRAWVR